MKAKLMLLILSSLLLQACSFTRHYVHPEKNRDALTSDEANCISKHRYQTCYTSHGTAETICKDNVVGYVNHDSSKPVTNGTICNTKSNPPKDHCYMTTDSFAVHNCLLAQGWREVDEHGNRK